MPVSQSDHRNEEQIANVVAQCQKCTSEHPLSERIRNKNTTICPECNSTRYVTVCNGEMSSKSDSERIDEALDGVRGVGKKNRKNIINTYSLYIQFEAATVEELCGIEGVGNTTAERIVKKVNSM